MNKTYMLDTCISSFIMREQQEAVLKRLEQAVLRSQRIVVSAITYAEIRFGASCPKASPRHIELVDAFCGVSLDIENYCTLRGGCLAF
ncbi:twitching motility protein PilT [Kosakonia radicincitans UMEnt01/12]|nr:twitching motility protein PilT [Kosakonia radicincitans UMEnt01/12]